MRKNIAECFIETAEVALEKIQSRHCHLKEHGFIWKESKIHKSTSSDPLWDVQVATRSKTTNGHLPIRSLQSASLKVLQDTFAKSRKIRSKKPSDQ